MEEINVVKLFNLLKRFLQIIKYALTIYKAFSMSKCLGCLIILISFFQIQAQTTMPLYEGEIPNSRQCADQESPVYNSDGILTIYKVSRPTLTIFLPAKEKATGAAVIICPGGSYSYLAAAHEGYDVARQFAAFGIAAFVLKYRIPDSSTMINKEVGPLQDAQRAILVIRSKASEWGIDPERVGIVGFSAGGHLASTAGTHFNKNYIDNPKHISLRPDFMILIYPVISFTPSIRHPGSTQNLLGTSPSQEKIIEYSNEMQVTDQTPPVFLVHAKDDNVVPYANSLEFAKALRIHQIPVELYSYDQGGHGFGLNNKTSTLRWMDACLLWLAHEHFLQ
jgi:acetyl esterase/lipase